MGEHQSHAGSSALTAPLVVTPGILFRRLRVELRDALELVLLPGLAAVLPWRWCFWLFQRLARWRWLYRESCEAALAQARARGWGGQDEGHWLWVRKLVTLVDHADHYLGLWRGHAWMQKHLQVQGAWPAPQALVLLTFHWGAGYWGLRHAARHGHHPHALMASLNNAAYAGRTVLNLYAKSRNRHVEKALGAIPFDVSVALKSVIKALRQGKQVLGVVDVPADSASGAIAVELLGMRAEVPRGLLRLVVELQLPAVVYITGLDVQTGQRFLRISPMVQGLSLDALSAMVFAQLQQVIAEDAPAWHFWAEAPRLFKPASGPTQKSP